VPGLADCLELRHPDLLGVFLSGAGSAVLAVTRKEVPEIAHQLQTRLKRQGVSSRVLTLTADNQGARLLPEAS